MHSLIAANSYAQVKRTKCILISMASLCNTLSFILSSVLTYTSVSFWNNSFVFDNRFKLFLFGCSAIIDTNEIARKIYLISIAIQYPTLQTSSFFKICIFFAIFCDFNERFHEIPFTEINFTKNFFFLPNQIFTFARFEQILRSTNTPNSSHTHKLQKFQSIESHIIHPPIMTWHDMRKSNLILMLNKNWTEYVFTVCVRRPNECDTGARNGNYLSIFEKFPIKSLRLNAWTLIGWLSFVSSNTNQLHFINSPMAVTVRVCIERKCIVAFDFRHKRQM